MRQKMPPKMSADDTLDAARAMLVARSRVICRLHRPSQGLMFRDIQGEIEEADSAAAAAGAWAGASPGYTRQEALPDTLLACMHQIRPNGMQRACRQTRTLRILSYTLHAITKLVWQKRTRSAQTAAASAAAARSVAAQPRCCRRRHCHRRLRRQRAHPARRRWLQSCCAGPPRAPCIMKQ